MLQRADKFAAISYPIKNAIFLYFLGQFERLAKLHSAIFSRAENDQTETVTTNWIKITFSLADNNALDMEKYLQKSTSFVLVSLSEKIRVANENKIA